MLTNRTLVLSLILLLNIICSVTLVQTNQLANSGKLDEIVSERKQRIILKDPGPDQCKGCVTIPCHLASDPTCTLSWFYSTMINPELIYFELKVRTPPASSWIGIAFNPDESNLIMIGSNVVMLQFDENTQLNAYNGYLKHYNAPLVEASLLERVQFKTQDGISKIMFYRKIQFESVNSNSSLFDLNICNFVAIGSGNLVNNQVQTHTDYPVFSSKCIEFTKINLPTTTQSSQSTEDIPFMIIVEPIETSTASQIDESSALNVSTQISFSNEFTTEMVPVSTPDTTSRLRPHSLPFIIDSIKHFSYPISDNTISKSNSIFNLTSSLAYSNTFTPTTAIIDSTSINLSTTQTNVINQTTYISTTNSFERTFFNDFTNIASSTNPTINQTNSTNSTFLNATTSTNASLLTTFTNVWMSFAYSDSTSNISNLNITNSVITTTYKLSPSTATITQIIKHIYLINMTLNVLYSSDFSVNNSTKYLNLIYNITKYVRSALDLYDLKGDFNLTELKITPSQIQYQNLLRGIITTRSRRSEINLLTQLSYLLEYYDTSSKNAFEIKRVVKNALKQGDQCLLPVNVESVSIQQIYPVVPQPNTYLSRVDLATIILPSFFGAAVLLSILLFVLHLFHRLRQKRSYKFKDDPKIEYINLVRI